MCTNVQFFLIRPPNPQTPKLGEPAKGILTEAQGHCVLCTNFALILPALYQIHLKRGLYYVRTFFTAWRRRGVRQTHSY